MRTLKELVDRAALKGKIKLAVAAAQDPDLIRALARAIDAGFVEALFVGNKEEITPMALNAGIDPASVEILHEPDVVKACEMAVRMVKEGIAAIIVKGNVRTSTLVRCILDKDMGLLSGNLLSHIAFFESPYYHKILGITDAALNIAPDINDKINIVNNAVDACRKLDIIPPKIGILAAIELVNEKMEATVHAGKLKQLNRQNIIKGCIIDGPLALDNAISSAAADHKGIISDVAGDADVLVVPDINSGNILYKSLSFLGGATAAAVVVGASVPVVLTSRSDSDNNKFFSIALATALL